MWLLMVVAVIVLANRLVRPETRGATDAQSVLWLGILGALMFFQAYRAMYLDDFTASFCGRPDVCVTDLTRKAPTILIAIALGTAAIVPAAFFVYGRRKRISAGLMAAAALRRVATVGDGQEAVDLALHDAGAFQDLARDLVGVLGRALGA